MSEAKVYKVEKGFMAFQFDEGKPVYSIGIEKNAITTHGIYKCVIGKEKREVTVTLDDIDRLIEKYGRHRIIRKRNNKPIYIIPLRDIEDKSKKEELEKILEAYEIDLHLLGKLRYDEFLEELLALMEGREENDSNK